MIIPIKNRILIIDSVQLSLSTHPSKFKQDASSVLGNVQGTNAFSSGTDKPDRPIVINCSVSSNQNAISILQKNADSGFTTLFLSSAKYSFGSKVQTGIHVMDPKIKTVKWKLHY